MFENANLLYVYVVIAKIDHSFLFPFSQLSELRRTGADFVRDVGHDHVRALDHPAIAEGDCKAPRNVLDAFGQDRIGIVGRIERIAFLRHIRQDNVISDRIAFGEIT